MSADRSTDNERTRLPLVRSDHHCFGCGAENPIGLHLSFTVDDSGVHALFVPGLEHQGFDGVVHGGILSTLLDEAMAWATAAAGIWALTAEMHVRFRRPVRVGERIIVSALVDSERRRLVTTSATLLAEVEGELKASATATFMRVDPASEATWRRRYLLEAAPDGCQDSEELA